jgi:hypothetical protein
MIGLSVGGLSQSAEWNLNFEEWDSTYVTPSLWFDTTVVENRIGLFPPKWHYRSGFILKEKD